MLSLFESVVQMSVNAAIAAVAVWLVGLLLHRLGAPRRINCLLWGLVLFRALCPVSFPAPAALTQAAAPIRAAAAPLTPAALVLPELLDDISSTSGPVWAVWVWAVAAAVLMGRAAFCNLQLWRQTRLAYRTDAGWYTGSGVDTPFLHGLFCPHIYIPEGLAHDQAEAIFLHEKAHLRHGDHWFKPLFFLAVCLHWFNPVLWLAFRAMVQDLEAACDEEVIRQKGERFKLDYCRCLLQFALHRYPASCPPAFGEGCVKARIKSVLNYRRPTFWVLLVCILLAAGTGMVCLADSSPTLDAVLPVSEDAGVSGPQSAKSDSFSTQAASAPTTMAVTESTVPATDAAADAADASATADLLPGFAPAGTASFTEGFIWPVPDYRYVSRWMGGQYDAATNSGSYHLGSDLCAEKGAPILAMAEGIVVQADYHSSYGNIVVLEHSDGYRTLYAHCDSLLVSAGDTVAQGQEIATVGNTGNTSGIQCHVEILQPAPSSQSDYLRENLKDYFPDK